MEFECFLLRGYPPPSQVEAPKPKGVLGHQTAEEVHDHFRGIAKTMPSKVRTHACMCTCADVFIFQCIKRSDFVCLIHTPVSSQNRWDAAVDNSQNDVDDDEWD